MDDLISRQAAIDIERNATVDTNPSHFEAHQKFTQFMDDAEVSSFGRWQWSNGFNTALTAVGIDLKKLPSAHPDVPVINVGDMISRQDAIKAICEDGTWLERQGCTEITMAERKQRDADIIGKLPPVQPKRGKWLPDNRCGGGYWVCSSCKHPTEAFAADVLYKYCPFCGADMRCSENPNS